MAKIAIFYDNITERKFVSLKIYQIFKNVRIMASMYILNLL